jgi:hypothetical protein
MRNDSDDFDTDEYERWFFQQHVPTAIETLKRILYDDAGEMDVRLEAGRVLASYGMAEAVQDERVPEDVRTFLMGYVPTRH